MANRSLQLLDVSGVQSIEDLVNLLQENFEVIKLLIDGLTGERLEDWTPVLRSGIVKMTGDLQIDGAGVKLINGDQSASLRMTTTGVLETQNADKSWRHVRDERAREDVTSDRAFDEVYTNGSNREMEVYVQIQVGG